MTKQELVENNMRLVYGFISKEFPTYINDEDLVQAGMLGLCQAAEAWDENKGKFSTFAYICIRNEVCTELKNRSKHQGVLSLDYVVKNEDGETTTFGDCIACCEDVGYVDTSVDYAKLTERERSVYALLVMGVDQDSIVDKLGVTQSFIAQVKRKCRLIRSRE